jgi:hypothetical protein
MNFDLNYIEIFKEMKILFKTLFNDHLKLSNFKLSFLCTSNTNLGALTVNNLDLSDFNKFKGTLKCDALNCFTCKLIKTQKFLNLNNFLLPLADRSNCMSKGVIYAINCIKCYNVFYIGETERAVKLRIREHILSIKNFVPFSNNNSEIATHFNLKGHSFKDFCFFILKDEINDSLKRKQTENYFLHLFTKLDYTCINKQRSSLYLYNFIIN